MKKCFVIFGLAVSFCYTAYQSNAGENGTRKPPPGFKALFNGKNLENWQGDIPLPTRKKTSPEKLKELQEKVDAKVLPNWTVQKNGVLRYAGKGGSLATVKNYHNFELYVDWKIMEKGDSGIYLRGVPQVQIWDPNLRKIGSGGLFNNRKNPSKPLVTADNPIGEWNTFHIIMRGDRVTVFLNGKKVVDNTKLENYWDRSAPLPESGPIMLQHHGNPLWFRNIFIKELPD